MDIENFPTNETAQRMMSMLSPIYDKAYVAKWIFEVLGACLGQSSEILQSIAEEAFPNTSMEMLSAWEEMYSLKPGPGASIEERRRAIVTKRNYKSAMNPERIKALVKEVSGCDVELHENTARSTYDIYIYSGAMSTPLLDSRWNAIQDTAGDPIWMNEEPNNIPYDDIARVVKESKQANKHVNIIFVNE